MYREAHDIVRWKRSDHAQRRISSGTTGATVRERYCDRRVDPSQGEFTIRDTLQLRRIPQPNESGRLSEPPRFATADFRFQVVADAIGLQHLLGGRVVWNEREVRTCPRLFRASLWRVGSSSCSGFCSLTVLSRSNGHNGNGGVLYGVIRGAVRQRICLWFNQSISQA